MKKILVIILHLIIDKDFVYSQTIFCKKVSRTLTKEEFIISFLKFCICFFLNFIFFNKSMCGKFSYLEIIIRFSQCFKAPGFSVIINQKLQLNLRFFYQKYHAHFHRFSDLSKKVLKILTSVKLQIIKFQSIKSLTHFVIRYCNSSRWESNLL